VNGAPDERAVLLRYDLVDAAAPSSERRVSIDTIVQ
jgi:hypothetical protein